MFLSFFLQEIIAVPKIRARAIRIVCFFMIYFCLFD
jgi:hypothetical protein